MDYIKFTKKDRFNDEFTVVLKPKNKKENKLINTDIEGVQWETIKSEEAFNKLFNCIDNAVRYYWLKPHIPKDVADGTIPPKNKNVEYDTKRNVITILNTRDLEDSDV